MQQEELLIQIDALKEQLLNLLTIWYKEHTEVFQQIIFIYENIFGDIEVEIEQKEDNAKKLEQKYKMLARYVETNEPIKRQSIEFIDKLLFGKDNILKNKKTSNYHKKYNFTNKNKSHRLDTSFNDEIDIANLYRSIVKKLHPDIIGESNIFNLCWANVQYCYKKQDALRLKMFYLILCCKYENNLNVDIMQLKKDIDELKSYIEKQNEDIIKLQQEEPYCFKDKLDDKQWIIERKNELRHKLTQANKRILHNNRLLRQIKIVD